MITVIQLRLSYYDKLGTPIRKYVYMKYALMNDRVTNCCYLGILHYRVGHTSRFGLCLRFETPSLVLRGCGVNYRTEDYCVNSEFP